MPIKSSLASTASAVRRPGFTVTDVVGALLEFHERWRQRIHLSELDDRTLADLGLSRADVYEEARKPFWRG